MTRALKREFERFGAGSCTVEGAEKAMEEKMGKFLSKVVAWFEGKKTILGGILVIGAAAAGEWYGKIDPATALAIGGMGFAAVGLGDKANRHQAQLLAALLDIAQAGANYRTGNASGALKAVEGMAATLAPIAGASLHLSADSPGELAAAIQSLAGSAAAPVPDGSTVVPRSSLNIPMPANPAVPAPAAKAAQA